MCETNTELENNETTADFDVRLSHSTALALTPSHTIPYHNLIRLGDTTHLQILHYLTSYFYPKILMNPSNDDLTQFSQQSNYALIQFGLISIL